MSQRQRPIRVLQIGKFYPPHPGGMETHLEQLSTHMQQFADVRVLVSNAGRRSITERRAGVLVHRAGTVARFANTSISPGMLSAIRHSPAEIVHIHWPNPTAVLAYLASGHQGRLVVTYHSDIVKQKIPALLFHPLLTALLSRCAAVIATSQQYIDTSPVLRRFRNICHVIPFGIDTGRFINYDASAVADVRRKYGPRLILAVGRLVYYKGFEYLVQAMRSVNGRALIIGDGPLRDGLKSLAVRWGVAERVTFMGQQFVEDLVPYFHACDLFVLPSIARSEAFGIVQLEAMACGKPVVNTTLDSGVPFVSRDGITGLTVPPADSLSLATAINKLLDDNQLRSRYGEAARKRVSQEFKLETMVHRTCRLYAQLMEFPGLMNSEGFNLQYGLPNNGLLPNTLDKTSF
jgi:glycosyltransferase involved in cell wall biosynthesis